MAEVKLSERWKVLVVGNNPIELSLVFDRLRGITNCAVLAEMAFDLQSILQRLGRFSPQHILIDDNIGKHALHDMIEKLHGGKTKDIPITILKNSNYHEALGSGVMNYVLKNNLTSELLYRELENSQRFHKTQQYWNKIYRKRKGQLARLIQSAADQI